MWKDPSWQCIWPFSGFGPELCKSRELKLSSKLMYTFLCSCLWMWRDGLPWLSCHDRPYLELWDKISYVCPKSLLSEYCITERETKLKHSSEKYSNDTNFTNCLREWKIVCKLFLNKNFLGLPVMYPKVHMFNDWFDQHGFHKIKLDRFLYKNIL